MKKAAFAIALVGLAVLFPAPANARAQAMDPVPEVTAWLNALDAYDFESALALLDDDAFVIIMPLPTGAETIYEGKEEIRRVLESYKEDHARIQLVEPPRLEYGTVTWVERQSNDSLRRLGLASVDVLGEGLTARGKIRSILYSLTPESAARVQAVLAASKMPTGMPRTGGDADLSLTYLLVFAGLFTLSGILLRNVGRARHRRKKK